MDALPNSMSILKLPLSSYGYFGMWGCFAPSKSNKTKRSYRFFFKKKKKKYRMKTLYYIMVWINMKCVVTKQYTG